MRKHNGMRPQDVLVLLKILTLGETGWQSKDLSNSLGISQAEVSDSLNRSTLARLFNRNSRAVNRQNLLEFLLHGFAYVFPQVPGSLVRGIPTAHAHPLFKDRFVSEMNYVWPSPDGNEMGLAIEPLHKNQPAAAKEDDALYQMLACLDMLRVGKAREKEMAIEFLKNTILYAPQNEHNENQSRL